MVNILVLFAGAGLATRGLLNAGHQCTDVEIDPIKSYLSKMLNPEAKHIVADVMSLDSSWIASFDAVWASPPCQKRSDINTHDTSSDKYAKHDELLEWSLALNNDVLWVENVASKQDTSKNFGKLWNAAQFEEEPRQMRRRCVAGRYKDPKIYREFQWSYPKLDICRAIQAQDWQGGYKPKFARSEGWYGRKLSLREAAYHQGIDEIPDGLLRSWFHPTFGKTPAQWRGIVYEAIGNGVPVYMSEAFGRCYGEANQVASPLSQRRS